MKIVLTGGGSGGHITPVLAVAKALKRRQPNTELIYFVGKGDKLGDILHEQPELAAVHEIWAGKWRRYHGEGWRQLLDIPTLLKNIRDFFRFCFGLIQSWRLLSKIKPDGIFIKGGFVGVPVGWAARLHHIPYITHDSDVVPGLANRLIAKRASAHAVGMPKELYNYPQDKTFYTGVPIAEEYKEVSSSEQAKFRSDLGIAAYEPVLCISGGGLGAQRLNEAVLKILPKLFEAYPKLALLHIVGRDHEGLMNQQYDQALEPRLRKQVVVKGFVTDGYLYSGAADVVIARAGATSLVEYAAQAKPCIIVPNPQLTGGHQLKNAEQLAAHDAIRIVSEEELSQNVDVLFEAIEKLLAAPAERAALGKALHGFARPDAADRVADLLLQTFTKNTKHETPAQKV